MRSRTHADSTTRVHVLVSRFLPEFNAFPPLADNSLPAPGYSLNPFRPSLYQSSRTIGEEYRYVLERQGLKSFAGNLLPRPGLLLNPWAAISRATRVSRGDAPGLPLLQAVVPGTDYHRRHDGRANERGDPPVSVV